MDQEYDIDTWRKEQVSDPVLGRLRGLMQLHGTQRPTKAQVQGETPAVRHLCRQWAILHIDKDGLLIRRVHRSPVVPGRVDFHQRLVPGAWQKIIFLQVHRQECLHMGYDRVYAVVAKRFYWYNMSNDLQLWSKACRSCQQAKVGQGRGKTPLSQDFVCAPLQRCGMDLQGPFPESRSGNKYILVIQDYYSKWVELFGIPDKKAETVAHPLVTKFFSRYGQCERLHSDQGLEFENRLTHALCEMWGVKKTRTSPFAPWSNGQVERSNKTIKGIIRQMMTKSYHTDWDEKLPFVRMTLNNTVHASTGFTPHHLFFSQCEEARLPCDLLFQTTWPRTSGCEAEYVLRQRLVCQEIAEIARVKLERQASVQRASHARGGLKIRTYAKGDYVWRLWPPHLRDKLHGTPWTGPYEVLGADNLNKVVRLSLPSIGRGGGYVEKWVHTSNVKPVVFEREGRVMWTQPPSLDWRGKLEWSRLKPPMQE